MKYMTTRYFYPHGIEGEAMDCTYKEFDTIEKAIKYAHRYNKGMRFAGVQIEEVLENGKLGNMVYEITSDNEMIDYREEEKKEGNRMFKLDVYYFTDNSPWELVDTITAKTEEECEDKAELLYGHNEHYHWNQPTKED